MYGRHADVTPCKRPSRDHGLLVVGAATIPSRRRAMGGRRSALPVPIALAVAPVILAQTLSIPAFVVPTFADLTIRKRHSF